MDKKNKSGVETAGSGSTGPNAQAAPEAPGALARRSTAAGNGVRMGAAPGGPPAAGRLLRTRLRNIEALLDAMAEAGGTEGAARLADRLDYLLGGYLDYLEDIGFPSLARAGVDDALRQKAEAEADTLIVQLSRMRRSGAGALPRLRENLGQHINTMTSPDGLIAAGTAKGVDFDALAGRLTGIATTQSAGAPKGAATEGRRIARADQYTEYSTMPSTQMRNRDSDNRYGGNIPERDDRGRFMSDDDNDHRSARRSSPSDRDRDENGRFTSDDNDRGGYRRSSSGERDRDENGRFTSDENDRGGYRRSSSSHRDRDENGRFTSDDNDRGGYRRSSSSQRDRDENGRFTSDDNDRGGYRRSSSGDRDRDENGRFTSDDNDRGGYRRSSSGERDRDENGRFTSDDNDRGGYRRSSSSDRDRDENGRFMSEDNDRGSYRSSGNDRMRDEARSMRDDDRSYRSAGSRSDYDESRRSSRSRDDDDRSSSSNRHGGWFGDAGGHSEAARRGWEGRDDHRSSARSGNDDRRSGGGSGHGGWFGDSEGHSEAARRGWNDRR